MSFDFIDRRLSVHAAKMQAEVEKAAIDAILAAKKAGSGLRDAVSGAVPLITDENNWLTLVDILQQVPMALPHDVEVEFFHKCPKPALEELVAGEKGVFSYLIDRLETPIEEGKVAMVRKGDERLMHIVVDSMVALGQSARLKKIAALLQDMSRTRYAEDGQDGRLPGSVYHKLVENKILERPAYMNGNSNNGHNDYLNTRPARRFSNGGNADMGGNPNIPASEPEKVIRDTHSAQPPNGAALPDKGLAAQLAALKPAPAKSETATVQ